MLGPSARRDAPTDGTARGPGPRRRATTAVAVGLLALAGSAAAADAAPLRVLLTNDDGITAPGLVAVRDELCRAGYRVSVVAPTTNQSGSGGRLTSSGSVAIQRETYRCGGRDEASWGVAGSPADTVLVARQRLYRRRAPDLVVSGSNAGQNLSGAIGHSGTIGAALTGIQLGVPSIAVSTGIVASQLTTGTQATLAAYAPTARLVRRVADRLAATRGRSRLLPANVALNVNLPVVVGPDGGFDAAKLGAPQLTRVWPQAPLGFQYAPNPDGSVSPDVRAGLGRTPGAPRGTDVFAFDRRHPTVAPLLGGAANVSAADRRALGRRLRPVLR